MHTEQGRNEEVTYMASAIFLLGVVLHHHVLLWASLLEHMTQVLDFRFNFRVEKPP